MKNFLLVMPAVALLGACVTSNEMAARDYWARAAPKDGITAVYMTLQNHTGVDDELIRASSDSAQAVEIHESRLGADGVMQMVPQASVPLADDSVVEFEPGGLHIMLIGLKQDLAVGSTITLILNFKNHDDITLTVPVKDAADMGGSGMDGHTVP